MDPDKAAHFNADPDDGAAAYFGLTKIQYLQWIDTDGTPLCGHRTGGGDLCRNPIGRSQMRSDQWIDRHRKGICSAHAREVKKKRS